MCVNLPPENLNPDPYPPHLTSIYTYKMITVPKMCGNIYIYIYILGELRTKPLVPMWLYH